MQNLIFQNALNPGSDPDVAFHFFLNLFNSVFYYTRYICKYFQYMLLNDKEVNIYTFLNVFIACDWYIFSKHVNLMYLCTFLYSLHYIHTFSTPVTNTCVTVWRENDTRQFLLQIKI